MRRRAPAALSWLGALLAIYLIAPLAAGLAQADRADWRSVDASALLRASAVSVATASIATIIIALGGIPLGYMLARTRGRASATLGFLVQIPLALPPLASGILLLFLVGYGAPLGRLTNGALTDSLLGIVIAEVFVAAPFLIIAARAAFLSMDGVLEGVAATLGRGPWETFFRVSLPLAWPTIFSGLMLAWLRAFGEFGATLMVAYHPYSLPVYTYVAFGSQGLPAMLPVLLPTIVLALAVMALSEFARQHVTGRFIRWRARTWTENKADSRSRPLAKGACEDWTSPNLTLRLQKRLGNFCLDVSWSAQARRLAILGPSGSGKSLILRLIAGIEQADEELVLRGERTVSGRDPADRAVAYVPQNYGLFPNLTVSEQLRFPAGADPHAAQRWIKRLGLGGLEGRYPSALSLGQQQRVALARALVRPASLILLDEPFSALDAPLRSALRYELLTLQREFSATTILVTHDPYEAALLADDVLVLAEGQALQSGPTAHVFSRPASEIVARLLGAESVGEGVAIDDDRISIGDGVILKTAGPALREGARIGWAVRPGRVRLSPAGAYSGVIESVLPLGVGRQLAIRLGEARLRAVVDGDAYTAGDSCRLDIEPSSVQIWPRL